MPNVTKLGSAAMQAMMDDQMATISWNPTSNGAPASIPSGGVINVSVDQPSLVSIDSVTDPTTLTVGVSGVKGQAGTAVVTGSFTNPDGTVATGEVTFNITIDPAELDVTDLAPTVSTPVPQPVAGKARP